MLIISLMYYSFEQKLARALQHDRKVYLHKLPVSPRKLDTAIQRTQNCFTGPQTKENSEESSDIQQKMRGNYRSSA